MPERYKEEIEDILAQQAGQLEHNAPARRSWRRNVVSRLRLGGLLSPGKVLIASVVLLLTALLVRGAAPGFVSMLFWLGLLAFIAAYAMFFVRWGGDPQRRWRGRPVDDTSRSGWRSRLRRRFRV